MSNHLPEPRAKLIAAKNAAKTSVAIFDLSDRTQVEITGSDRIRFLHSFTSNDIKRLKPGTGCETFVTNLKGKIVAHVFVFCTEHSLWLDGTPGQQEAIKNHLSKFVLIDDVQFVCRDVDRGELFLTGPLATSLLQLDDGMAVGGNVSRKTGGEPFDVRRVDLFGAPGYLLSIPRTQIDVVKASLISLGVTEGAAELFEFLRIESGFPRYGWDLTDENLAQEAARTKQCISFDKGCYLGQETIARLDALGHTNQELRRLRFETDVVPNSGAVIYNEAGSQEVGIVTSAASGPGENTTETAGTVIALGLMKRSALSAGTALILKSGDTVAKGLVL